MKITSPHICGKCNKPVKLEEAKPEEYHLYPQGFKILDFAGHNLHECFKINAIIKEYEEEKGITKK